MLNYEKWKKLNESFMMSNPMSVISPKGLLAYTPLHEKMEEDEEDVEDEDEDEDMEDEDEDMEDEDEDMEDEDEDMEDEDEDMEDEDEDMEDEDEDMEDEDEDEDMEDEDEDMEDEDEDMEDEVDMQDETGEVEVVEDGDEDEDEHHHHHDHGKMVVAKKCGYCGSYMKAENANNFDSSPDFQEWLESVNSIINPRINSRLNGDILNEGTIPPQFIKYIKAKKKGKKVLDKTSSNKGKKVVGKKVVSKKKGKKTASKKTAKKCNCHSTEMKVMPKKSRSMISKKSWKNSPKK